MRGVKSVQILKILGGGDLSKFHNLNFSVIIGNVPNARQLWFSLQLALKRLGACIFSIQPIRF